MDNDFIEAETLDIIKGCPDLAHAINQYKITKEINIEWFGDDNKIRARAIRRVIEDLIKQGHPIISSPNGPGGYCYGGAEGEALKCYKRLRRKGIKILIRARRIMRNERNRKGQGELF